MHLPRFGWQHLSVWLACALAASAADPLDDADQNAREWLQLRVEAARLESAWRGEHQLVESTVAALKERATLAEEKRELFKARTAQERTELEAMRARNRAATDDLKAAEARLTTITTRLLALRPSLPPRLSDALEMAYRSLADPVRPLGERLQVASNVLNRCAQFNRLVTAGEEVLTLEGMSAPKSLETLYWGLSHGYALDRNTHQAWLGSPGPTGWRWEARPEAAEGVGRLLAVARDQANPEMVPVPAALPRVQTTSGTKGAP